MENLKALSTVELYERIASTTEELIAREIALSSLKTEKRYAQVGERILIVNALSQGYSYENGSVGTVMEVDEDYPEGVTVKEWDIFVYHDEYEVIIEEEAIEHEENTTKNVKDGIDAIAHAFKGISRSSDKSPNHQRAELIQRAKNLVENRLKAEGLVINHDYYKNPTISFFRKGSKITCVITPENTMLKRFVGRSICLDGDVYNTHIGEAIALYKALQKAIPQEFLNAVQPTQFAVGQTINYYGYGSEGRTLTHDILRIDAQNKRAYFNSRDFHYLHRAKEDGYTIIDDSNAIYV